MQVEGNEDNRVSNVTLTEVRKMRDLTSEIVWNITSEVNTFDEKAWKRNVSAILKMYQRKIAYHIKKGYDGSDEIEVKWSFPGAFLYSLTVITTIGKYLKIEK